jgi:hypothetical protein
MVFRLVDAHVLNVLMIEREVPGLLRSGAFSANARNKVGTFRDSGVPVI